VGAQLVEVRFKGHRKAFYRWAEPELLALDEAVLVEAERGLDWGRVSAAGPVAEVKCSRCGALARAGPAAAAEAAADEALPPAPSPPEPERRVVRRASPEDTRIALELRHGEDDVRRRVRERAQAHGLALKVSDAEWQWDRNKLTVYFTAERRVDFRSLVRDLASLFRTRIELRQIGVRDEAKRLDGIGRCGRQLCCTWLPELRPIGLQVAKDQRLSLNPTQISGPCGRLLCCLRYEHDFYLQTRKRFPKEGKALTTARGQERVVTVDIFRERVTLKAEDGTSRVVGLADLRREIDAGAAPERAAAPAPPPAEPAHAPPPTAGAAAAPEAGTAPPARRRRRRGRRRRRPR
jgi:cell fate regulator YaaT (PSP1 superfamily)